MRKSVIDGVGLGESGGALAPDAWFDLEKMARVEVSSEDDLFPVEHALVHSVSTGWRASVPGPQVIRLLFDEATAVRRIQVHVVERAAERSQEFAIYAGDGAGEMREVVRQQFTFSPGGSTEEVEEYAVALEGVRVMELRIDPDRAHDAAKSVNYASVMAWRVGRGCSWRALGKADPPLREG